MIKKEEMQMKAFEMIAIVGSAKSYFIESMEMAKEKRFDEAKKSIEEGRGLKNQAHQVHFDLIQLEAQGVDLPFSLILMHAEDQLLTSEVFQTMAEELLLLREELSSDLRV